MGMSGKDEKIDYELQQESVDETIEASLRRFPSDREFKLKKTLSTMSDEVTDKHAVIDNHMPGLIIATGFPATDLCTPPPSARSSPRGSRVKNLL